MIIALVHLVSREAVATCATLELKHAGEEFPEDVRVDGGHQPQVAGPSNR